MRYLSFINCYLSLIKRYLSFGRRYLSWGRARPRPAEHWSLFFPQHRNHARTGTTMISRLDKPLTSDFSLIKRYLLFKKGHLSFLSRYLSLINRYLSFISSILLFTSRYLWFIKCSPPFIKRYLPFRKCYVSITWWHHFHMKKVKTLAIF